MALDDSTTARLDYLLQQLLEAELSPAERAELERLLAESDLEDRFVHEIEVESALRNLDRTFDVTDRVMRRIREHLAALEAQRAVGPRRLRTTLAEIGHHPWRVAGVLAAAALLVIGCLWMVLRQPAGNTMTIEEGVSDDATPQTQSAAAHPASLDDSGHLALARNTSATLELDGGVQLHLGLEADMTLVKEPGQSPRQSRRLRLSAGRLDATIAAQPGLPPFTIQTPQALVLVTGGAVDVFVSPRATEVHALTGAVKVERLAGAKPLDAPAGQYAVLRDDLEPAAHLTQPLRCLFDEDIDPACFWTSEAGTHGVIRQDSMTGSSSLRLTPQVGRVSLAGMALRIREHPQAGEFRFLTFAWRKEGGGRIALQLDHADEAQDRRKQGRLSGYRFDAGEGAPVDGRALRTDGTTPQAWWRLTRDLWQDFGDFTITGLTFICPDGTAASFDSIYVGQTPGDFNGIARLPVPGGRDVTMELAASGELGRWEPPALAAAFARKGR